MTATVGLNPRGGEKSNRKFEDIVRTQQQDWVYVDLTRREI